MDIYEIGSLMVNREELLKTIVVSLSYRQRGRH
jgi:hypothetical protein